MPLIEEVAAWLEETKWSLFDFRAETFCGYLPADDIERLFPGRFTVPADFEPAPYTRESVLADLLDYLPFAIDKAKNKRSLSAMRSMQRMQLWLHLLGNDELAGQCANYDGYGLDVLHKIAASYEEA